MHICMQYQQLITWMVIITLGNITHWELCLVICHCFMMFKFWLKVQYEFWLKAQNYASHHCTTSTDLHNHHLHYKHPRPQYTLHLLQTVGWLDIQCLWKDKIKLVDLLKLCYTQYPFTACRYHQLRMAKVGNGRIPYIHFMCIDSWSYMMWPLSMIISHWTKCLNLHL